MTRIRTEKTVKRETASLYRGRPLIVRLHPRFVEIRPKGKRTSVSVGYEAIYEFGWKVLARQQAAEKKQRKGR
jgi:hypothetical protein